MYQYRHYRDDKIAWSCCACTSRMENPFLDGSSILTGVNCSRCEQKNNDDGFSLFGIFFMMMLFKGVFASLAGPAPNYDMQKILSTRSPQEASKMSGFVSIILLPCDMQ